MSTVCRSCSEPIMWAYTAENRRMPIDPEPTKVGNVLVLRDVTGLRRAHVLSPGEAKEMQEAGTFLHTSHFATCPQADEHRRSG